MASFALLKGAVDVAINTKKAIEFFKTLGQAEEEGFYLWRMLDSLTPSLKLAVALRRRHATLPLVESAVELCRFTIARCEEILQRDSSEEDARPEDAKSWQKWFSHKKEGVTRRQAVKDMLPKIAMCQHTLQLALTSLMITVPPQQLQPRAPFAWCPGAHDMAVDIVHEFEFGRVGDEGLVVCKGEVQKSELASGVRKGGGGHAIWRPRGERNVSLVMDGEGAFSLRFTRMRASPLGDDEEDGSDSDQGEGDTESVTITAAMPFRRVWMDEVPNLEVDAEDADRVVYIIGDYILLFNSVAKVSAECFESVIVMLKRMAPHEGKERVCLGEAVSDVRASEWKEHLVKQLGPFATQQQQQGGEDLLSPMRAKFGSLGI